MRHRHPTTTHTRTRRASIATALLAIASAAVVTVAPAAADDLVSPTLAVRTSPSADIDTVVAATGAQARMPLAGRHDLHVLRYPDVATAEDALDDLEDRSDVRWVVPHEPAQAPRAQHHSWAWPDSEAQQVTADAVWRSSRLTTRLGLDVAHHLTRGRGTTVAVLDTGVDRSHPAFADAEVQRGWDLVGDGTDPEDATPGTGSSAGHGTHVAGLVHLVAPEAALLPIRVLDADGRGSLATMILGIELAIDGGADVINLSLGTDARSEVLEDLLEEAQEAGVVVVAAVGNRGADREEYPARINEVVAVAAVDDDDRATTFTSDGDWVDLAAPGEAVLGPYPGGAWARWSGTSMAAPLVAGQAALLRSLDPRRSAEDVVDLIDETVVEVERRDSAIGKGRIDVGRSVTAMRAG